MPDRSIVDRFRSRFAGEQCEVRLTHELRLQTGGLMEADIGRIRHNNVEDAVFE